MDGVKRLTAAERDAMMNLSVADQIVSNAIRDLGDERVRMVRYMKRDLKCVEKKLEKMLEAVLGTIPPEQQRTYCRSLMDASYTTGVKCRATSGNEQRRKDEYGLYLTFSEIEGLLDAAKEKCHFCGLDKEGIRRCPLRKTLDAIPNDAPDSDGTDCPYYRIM